MLHQMLYRSITVEKFEALHFTESVWPEIEIFAPITISKSQQISEISTTITTTTSFPNVKHCLGQYNLMTFTVHSINAWYCHHLSFLANFTSSDDWWAHMKTVTHVCGLWRTVIDMFIPWICIILNALQRGCHSFSRGECSRCKVFWEIMKKTLRPGSKSAGLPASQSKELEEWRLKIYKKKGISSWSLCSSESFAESQISILCDFLPWL